MEFPALLEAIPNIVTEGLTILGGRPKEGKSFMALDFCLAVASGGHALGKIQVAPGEALYIGLEDSYRRIKNRVERRFDSLCRSSSTAPGLKRWPRPLNPATW
jgi:RecA-family ATPase